MIVGAYDVAVKKQTVSGESKGLVVVVDFPSIVNLSRFWFTGRSS